MNDLSHIVTDSRSTYMAAYYKLDDGRIWSIDEAKFVLSSPEEYTVSCFKSDGKTAEEVLAGRLRFYGYPLGELATDEDLAKEARGKRDELLAKTDFMAMPDYPLDEPGRAAIFAYRQALRDVPGQAGFPRRIDWPVRP